MWPVACQAACLTGAVIAASLGVRIPWSIWLILIGNCLGIASNYMPPTRSRRKYYLVLGFVLLSILAVVSSVITRT